MHACSARHGCSYGNTVHAVLSMCMANQKWDPTMNLATEYAEKSGQNS